MSNAPERLMQMATGYWASATLSAAVELGVFDALADGSADAESLAKRAGASSPHLLRLLEALAALGVLRREQERFSIDPSLRPLLSPSSPTCLLDALRFNLDMYPLWARLGSSIRAGQPALPPSAHLGDDPGRTERFVRGMHSRAMMLAPAVVEAIDLGDARTLLDLAAGPGTFSRMLLERHPKLRSTLFDLPPVLDVARRLLESPGTLGRITLHPGDYRKDPLPGGFDAVLYCGALHQETPESAATLLRKIRDSLRPGGSLLVVDLMLAPDRTGPAFSALFSLNMMLVSPVGRVFDERETQDLLRAAGFDDVAATHPAGSPYTIVRARRPA
jgi:SAM-dependent methyltransferase